MINIQKQGDWSLPECQILAQALDAALNSDHNLSKDVLEMEGMSGTRFRMLINRLIALTSDARYLEIGSWKGSTACSAGYKNKVKIVCIDNWYQGNKVKEAFIKSIAQFLSDEQNVSFDHSDFRSVDYSSIGKFNVYFFDGPHEQQDQYDGVKLVQPALDDIYTLIVDDYNAEKVQTGTAQALVDLNHTVVASITVRTDNNPYLQKTDWHNGYYIAVIKKENK